MLLYIDPGTGSMLFTILIGILGAAIYAFRGIWMKLKFLIQGGNVKVDENRIPFVIFTDSKRYYTIFKPICDEMEKRGQNILYLTAEKNDPLLEEEYEYVRTEFAGEGNRAFARMNMLKADIVLSSTPGLDVYQWKRSRDVKNYIHVLHAPNVIYYRMFGVDYYDTLMLAGKYQIQQIRELENLRNLPEKEIVISGLPHMDALLERRQQSEQKTKSHTTVLIAPTWGPNGLFAKFGDKIIRKLLETEYQIIIRPHPQSFTSEKEMMDDLLAKFPESDRLHWDRSTDNFDTLNQSDILISDYSGVIFDFTLVFEKPVIYSGSSPDFGIFDAWWLENSRSLTFDVLESIGLQLNDDNIDHIDTMINQCLTDETFKDRLAKEKNKIWGNEGNAVQTIVDYMIEKREKLLSAEQNAA